MSLEQHDRASVILRGSTGKTTFEQTVSLAADAEYFHIDVKTSLGDEPPRVEYLLSTFIFEGDKVDYTHAPCMKREPADVIGDRVFHSPAVIFQGDSQFAALAPDLNVLKTDIVYAPEARAIDGPASFEFCRTPRPLRCLPFWMLTSSPVLARFQYFRLASRTILRSSICTGNTRIRTGPLCERYQPTNCIMRLTYSFPEQPKDILDIKRSAGTCGQHADRATRTSRSRRQCRSPSTFLFVTRQHSATGVMPRKTPNDIRNESHIIPMTRVHCRRGLSSMLTVSQQAESARHLASGTTTFNSWPGGTTFT